MKATVRPALLIGLLLAGLAVGCKKPPVAVRPTPTPTATPVPAQDVLAFTRRGELWISNWDGSQVRLLKALGSGAGLWFPAASPDGRHLIAWMSRPDGTQDLVRVDLDGRLTQLTEIGERAEPATKNLRLGNAPSYSPDGKRIAYAFNGNIWIMDANGYNAETFISDGASWSPAFSPDGKTLAYVNGNRKHYDLWLADLESRDTWQLTDFQAYSVGHPQWAKDGKRIVLTRSQGDESDVVQVLATADAPLADADVVITKDHSSASAVYSPEFTHLLFSSLRDGSHWSLVVSDAAGSGVRLLTKEDSLSPAWMRPSSGTALAFDATASRPTPSVPTPAPTAAQPSAAAPAPASAPSAVANAVHAAAPVAAATAVPAPKAESPQSAAPKPAAIATKAPSAAPKAGALPGAPAAPPTRPGPAAAAAGQAQPSKAPTQPPLKAAPLRMRFKTSFDDADGLSPASLAALRKLAPRVQQYDASRVQVIGPLDGSALRGRYASAEARSLARAQAVSKALAGFARADAAKIVAQPYSPATAGAGAANSIQIYVELK